MDTVICLALAGATAGFAAGIIAGGLFGLATYNEALAGKCGYEMQEQAIAAGSLGYYTGILALIGGIFGGVAGAIAAAAPIGLFIVGAAGIAISGYDAYKTYNIIAHETGITECTLLRGLMDIAGILGGVTAIRTSVQAFKNGGSWLKWSESPKAEPEPVPGEMCSFTGDTKVTTSEGDTPIREIKIGDYVLAWNEKTGEMSFQRVTNTLHHKDKTIVHLIIDGEEITTTPEHPFYLEGKGWRTAKDLQAGDQICSADKSSGEVENIKIEQTTQEMYNLTVANAHTYFVGDGQWLVHNTCKWLGNGPVSKWGEQLAELTDEVYEPMQFWAKRNSTIAIAENNGTEYVTSYGDSRAAEYLQVNASKYGLEYIPNNSGDHAEVFLYKFFNGDVDGIGVSHVNGPCPDVCTPFFLQKGFINVFWTGVFK